MFKHNEQQPEGFQASLKEALDNLAFNDAGLVAAIAQQHDSGEVLMMAWMNREAIEETLATGRVCYFSRSRRKLWRKGESSGQVQMLKELRIDCDGDALDDLGRVQPDHVTAQHPVGPGVDDDFHHGFFVAPRQRVFHRREARDIDVDGVG